MDAAFGLFFDGFSKILTATGIMIYAFGMPASIVIGKILPAIGVVNFLGNLWYFYEAKNLAEKERRQDVTSQPFGIGASQLTGWLYLIMGPIYWHSGDAMLAYRIALSAAFIGSLVEIAGAFCGRWIIRVIPHSALMGNMASAAIVWLSFVGMAFVFDKPIYAVLPLFIIIVDYLGKADKRFTKIPSGIIAIGIGAVISWTSGYLTLDNLVSSFSQVGFNLPQTFFGEIVAGLKSIVPYLPIIIPLQINNFLTTLQGLESAKEAGDDYPQRQSMIMDGVSTMIGSFLGNPFPTTVYFGHPSWKEIGARAGYSVVVAFAYLIIGLSGLTGIVMAIIPHEAVMVLLIFVGISVATSTLQNMDKKYFTVVLLSLIPIVFQYIQVLIDSAVQAAGTTTAQIATEKFAEYSVPIKGIQILSYGAFLSSLLMAALLAYVIDKKYSHAGICAIVLAVCSLVGIIHCESISLFPKDGVILGVIYMIVALTLFSKKYLLEKQGGKVLSEDMSSIPNLN
ncbi:uracil permease [Clostridium amylolyticum]|uniref:uracil permease n=1 Tax=Clostridium amylolyticum TaxID=1121298 RepID=UPI000ADED328|nr:uracil permease [Clostridium amylolyticum]